MSLISTILFDKRRWSVPKAKKWLASHGYSSRKVDVTTNYYRFRQHVPNPNRRYYTVMLPNYVHLVYTA